MTHLNRLAPKVCLGEIVPVDFIGCGVDVNGSNNFERYTTLWRKKHLVYCQESVASRQKVILTISECAFI